MPALHWSKVEILPKADAAENKLPTGPAGSHYYAARETDAALFRVTGGKKTEVEKFLFHRGVGSFTAPLTVQLDSADATRVALQNTGPEPLRDLYVCHAQDGQVSWERVESLAPGAQVTVLTNAGGAKKRSREMLAAALRESLTAAGLFPKEAAAMVQTWEDSWLGETGLRVLYTLPRAWTDRTLPLTITPAPARTERVMMAEKRAPEFSAYSWELLEKISAPEKPAATAATPAPL